MRVLTTAPAPSMRVLTTAPAPSTRVLTPPGAHAPPPRYPMPVEKDSKVSFCALLDEVLQADWNEGVVEFKAVGKSLPAGGKAAGSGASSSSEGGGLLPLSANGMAEKIALAISASPDAGAELVKLDTKAAGLDLTAYYWEQGEYLKAGKVRPRMACTSAPLIATDCH